MNSVQLTGRLAADPELRHTNQGTAVCEINLAVDRYGQDDPAWIGVVLWKEQAERFVEYLGKGRKVLIEGRLDQDQWETPDGSKRSKTKVVAHRWEFCDSKPNREQRSESQAQGWSEVKREVEKQPDPQPQTTHNLAQDHPTDARHSTQGDEIPF